MGSKFKMGMKATGIVRKMDDLGRIVVPKELRRTLGLDDRESVEIFVDGANVVLRKYQPGCKNCGAIDVPLRGEAEKMLLCDNCIASFTSASQR
jgi:transcriptional pleiotropic regulator of transition state genes